jgi:hypothetical protein
MDLMNTKRHFLAMALLSIAVGIADTRTGLSQSIVQFSAGVYTIGESADAATLVVQRSGDTNVAVRVDYATADGTATNGLNRASDSQTDSGPSLDLTTDVTRLDTVITRYSNHPPGGAVELWTINGGSHHPALSTQFSPLVIDWLLGHPKP